jgi:hypothetical protein
MLPETRKTIWCGRAYDRLVGVPPVVLNSRAIILPIICRWFGGIVETFVSAASIGVRVFRWMSRNRTDTDRGPVHGRTEDVRIIEWGWTDEETVHEEGRFGRRDGGQNGEIEIPICNTTNECNH